MKRIVVFLKYPEPGQAKTRLAETIGAAAATRLARHFAEQTMEAVDGLGLDVDLCFDPPGREAEIRAWIGRGRRCWPQEGTDLGQRMRRAFEAAFALGAERVALTGTDAPDRPREFLAEAFRCLDEHHAVLGPATDGGYHLLALRRDAFAHQAFENIAWGTPAVLAQTLDALRLAGRSAFVLPPWPDIDDEGALREYLERCPDAAWLLEDGHGR